MCCSVCFQELKCLLLGLCTEDMSVIEVYPMLEIMVGVGDGFDTAEDVNSIARTPVCSDDTVGRECVFHPLECFCFTAYPWGRAFHSCGGVDGAGCMSPDRGPKSIGMSTMTANIAFARVSETCGYTIFISLSHCIRCVGEK